MFLLPSGLIFGLMIKEPVRRKLRRGSKYVGDLSMRYDPSTGSRLKLN